MDTKTMDTLLVPHFPYITGGGIYKPRQNIHRGFLFVITHIFPHSWVFLFPPHCSIIFCNLSYEVHLGQNLVEQ